MSFVIDEAIASSCFILKQWPLSTVLLKNNASFPWLILVPNRPQVYEIEQLSTEDGYQLVDEIKMLSSIAQQYFKPDKLNIGALGNIVSQLHIHVVARYKHDALWPHGVWQAGLASNPYSQEQSQEICAQLKTLL